MVISNSYVSLPEGKVSQHHNTIHDITIVMSNTMAAASFFMIFLDKPLSFNQSDFDPNIQPGYIPITLR